MNKLKEQLNRLKATARTNKMLITKVKEVLLMSRKNPKKSLLKTFSFFVIAGLLFVQVIDSWAATGDSQKIIDHESKTIDLLTQIDAFAEEDAQLRMDAAKAHYNMGNIYFQKGEYEIAAREYYQAVTLMPEDPDVHYNLAFVSGEYLHDFKTALKHYRMYLYLSPRAKDTYFVKEKIVHAKLVLDSAVDSPLEKIERTED